MVTVTPDGRDAFARAFAELADGASPDAIRRVERACPLRLVGRGSTRLAFRSDATAGEGPVVVKVALAGLGGRRAVEREAALWESVEDAGRDLLAPVLAADSEHRWLAMPVVETGVSVDRAREFHRRLTAAGLVLRDVTPGDVGLLDGRPVLVDYAGCKPVAEAPVTRSEMARLVEQRWTEWE